MKEITVNHKPNFKDCLCGFSTDGKLIPSIECLETIKKENTKETK